MMMDIKIQTLSPVHVGSGITFQGNFEYLYFALERKVAIIDEAKVFGIVGTENLDKWLGIIDRRDDLLAYLCTRRPAVTAFDTARRVLTVPGKAPSADNSIREHIHTNGTPFLPGSSIKGAIRTALLAGRVQEKIRFVQQTENLKNRYGKFDDEQLEKEIFGADPNHDYLRLLRVGDVHFEETNCLLAETVNQTGKGYEMKHTVRQFVESLPENSVGFGRIGIQEDLRREASKRQYFNRAADHLSLDRIFKEINANTQRLLQKEIAYWQDKDLPREADLYLESLDQLLEEARQCGPDACVLRLGFGIGYSFITGGWQEDLLDKTTMQQVAGAVRRRDGYENMPFPKTRRVMLNGRPMGFVKISVASKENTAAAQREKEAMRQHRREAEAANLRRTQEAEEKAQAERLRQEEEQRRLAEEARKPKPFTGKLKPGAGPIDAQVVLPGKPNKVKLWLKEPGQAEVREVVVDMTGYSSPVEAGTVVQVRINTLSGTMVRQVGFMNFKK